MDRQEAANWIAETKRSETRWMLDATTAYNQGEYLLYKGGVDGAYIRAYKSGDVSVGYYKGAYPHIGEAVFMPKFKKKFESQKLSLEYIMDKLNLGFIADLGYSE